MSTERYEIKGKIGEGGVGAVYHAYDTHLNRDVAIKRVLADGGYEDQEDATKSLLKEATALSSVQHPHIVTVYDAGIDADGPYVVMELIHGRTLDEMVERATMTWDDLREVALQSQEALIAAQDLDLVHRDLKPSNLMVCWLPSGKFQVKIVDFGLAKFSATPSLQTIAHGDAVFGSIFFMAPEQFERIPLDKCTDMYSMGCLYYYALTGVYPFNGDTAAAVMVSHLQHHVTPLHELRPDIPQWGCDWIMWHIEREMQARPQDARESLGRFLLLDQQSTQPITVTADNPAGAVAAAPAPAAGAPQFLFPTGAATPEATDVNTLTAPQPILAPNAALNLHTGTQAVQAHTSTGPQQAMAAPMTQPGTAPQPVLQAAQPGTAPQPVLQTPQPATAAQPVLQAAQPATAPQPVLQAPQPATAPQVQFQTAQPGTASQAVFQATAPQADTGAVPEAPADGAQPETGEQIIAPPKKGIPPAIKWTIVGLLSLVIIITVFVMMDVMKERKEIKLYNDTMIDAKAHYDAGDIQEGFKISREALDSVLKRAGNDSFIEKERGTQRAALAFARGDGFDADEVIVKYITTEKISPDLRADLFRYVMAHRKNPANIAPLLEFALNTDKSNSAAQAILAAKASLAGSSDADGYLDEFLSLIKNTEENAIRVAAERAAIEIILESSRKESFGRSINNAYKSAVENPPKYALLRLLGITGGDEAEETVTDALNSNDKPLQNAAIAALGKWADDTQYTTLTDFIADSDDSDSLRRSAFEAAYAFLKIERERDPDDLGDMWRTLSKNAKSTKEKRLIIRGMISQDQEWAITILDRYVKDKDDDIIDDAEQATKRVKRTMKNNK